VDAAEAIGGLTGEVFTAQIFVAVLGARIYTYAEATFTQSLPDIVGGSIRLGFGNGRRAKRVGCGRPYRRRFHFRVKARNA
jgi:hypothetical protein